MHPRCKHVPPSLSFSIKAHEAYYVPIPSNQNEAQIILDSFREIFEDKNKTLIGQNIKYDYAVLKNYNIDIKNKLSNPSEGMLFTSIVFISNSNVVSLFVNISIFNF